MRLIVAALCVAGGCASLSPPPGGPVDHDPPEIVSVSIDTNATEVKAGTIDVQFDEVISERPVLGGTGAQGLESAVLVSPRTGPTKVTWHRDRITIEPRGGFRANTAYRITLLPGIADIRGNVRKDAVTMVFTTGAKLPAFAILGRVFDWQAALGAPNAIVEAVANPGTADSLTYLGVTDSTGQFDVGPLDAGKYLMRAYVDADHNRALGPVEKWDTTSVTVTDHQPVVELLAIQRDTAPAAIDHIEVLDSAWIRVGLDKPIDPRMTLSPGLVTLQRADSSEVAVLAVMTEARASTERPRSDTTRQRMDTTRQRADSARSGAVTPPIVERPAPPAPLTDTVSTRPPPVRPSLPSPERGFVLRLAPGNALQPDAKYTLTVRGIRNLIGKSGTSSMQFITPKPPPPPKPPANDRDQR